MNFYTIFFPFVFYLIFLFFLVLLLIYLIVSKNTVNKKGLTKDKYLEMIDEMVHFSSMDHPNYNILLRKLSQLKEMIECSELEQEVEQSGFDQEINHLIKDLYIKIKYMNSSLELNQIYVIMEELINLLNRRKLILHSQHKKK